MATSCATPGAIASAPGQAPEVAATAPIAPAKVLGGVGDGASAHGADAGEALAAKATLAPPASLNATTPAVMALDSLVLDSSGGEYHRVPSSADCNFHHLLTTVEADHDHRLAQTLIDSRRLPSAAI